MKKMRIIGMVVMICLYIAVCGSLNQKEESKGQTGEVAQAEEVKAQKAEPLQKAESQDVPRENVQDAQTEWDGQEGQKEIPIKDKESTEEGGDTEKNSSEDTVEFMGVGSNEILSCTIYHGEGKEEIDLTEARGQCLLQMLDDFFRDPKYTYVSTDGIFNPEHGRLDDLVKSTPSSYFIYIELGKSITYPLQGQTLKNFNTVIIQANDVRLLLYYNIENDDDFYITMCRSAQAREMAADFMSRYQEWEQTEDWGAALEERKEMTSQISQDLQPDYQ